jgi:hypothetical protein
MRTFRIASRLLVCITLGAGVFTGVGAVVGFSQAGADTDPTTLIGQGGSFLEPVMSKLLNDDATNLNPLFGSYLLTDDVSSVGAFVGSGPGQFAADFAVTQRPLTAAESAQATTDGRSYADVAFAATPVAIATLVPTEAWSISGATSITSSGFCQNMPLTTALLGDLFGHDATPLNNWNDTRITCPQSGGGTTADGVSVARWANLDPSEANAAVMALLDSTPGSKADFDAGLAVPGGSLTTDDTPSELWPYSQNTIPGGDQPLIGKLLDINAETNAPSTQASTWQLGAIVPLSSVWTGSPLGVVWDLPTAAVQNAANAFVAPSVAAATAAESDATLATTTDPTTDNLVTFAASAGDAAAYNNYLMEESYLVVPTSGLVAAKATALAQLVRFVLGTQGQHDIESFGSAPATAAMQAAGLKVAAQLDAEGAAASDPTDASTTTTTTSATGSTSTTSASAAAAAASGTSDSGGSGDPPTGAASSGSGLAFTGVSHLGMWVASGVAMLGAGTIVRRRLKKRERSS